ncbi:MAG: hypothetical protein EAZ15_09505 [Sphingobacteriales bacterium]|nr:MAG: hypothetical protein EAZ15_09505 [Sphingobacteriales bacterium]
MTTLQINIPDDLASKVSKLTINAESHIIDLLKSKVIQLDQNLCLADEYRMASVENKQIMRIFSTVDLENWDDEY